MARRFGVSASLVDAIVRGHNKCRRGASHNIAVFLDLNPNLSQHPAIAQALEDLSAEVEDVLFIVLASPVEEIGRDHDFDWGVVEPSSLHAIIQLVGRITRSLRSRSGHARKARPDVRRRRCTRVA